MLLNLFFATELRVPSFDPEIVEKITEYRTFPGEIFRDQGRNQKIFPSSKSEREIFSEFQVWTGKFFEFGKMETLLQIEKLQFYLQTVVHA